MCERFRSFSIDVISAIYSSRFSLSLMLGELASTSMTNSLCPVLLNRIDVDTSSRDMPFLAIRLVTSAKIPGLIVKQGNDWQF